MRERSIVFSAPMMKAILADRKSQTRRVVTGAALHVLTQGGPPAVAELGSDLSPYGGPGARLWIKEAWRVPASLNEKSGSQIADDMLDAGYCKPWAPIEYVADGVRNREGWWKEWGAQPADRLPGRYRHARFMPRWASRVTLEVTALRAERLQDISTDDCFAEGIEPSIPRPLAQAAYKEVWTKTTGDWEANPWVWVIEFKRIDK